MFPFAYRQVRIDGLRAATGSFGYTVGVFHIETRYDSLLEFEPEDVQKFVIWHEEAHVRGKHGLLAVLLLPLRPVLIPVFETIADRYAIRRLGVKRARVALRRIYPRARSFRGIWLNGRDWRERAERAGAG